MAETKRVVIAGATGEIGRALCARLSEMPEYSFTVISRDAAKARQSVPGAVDYLAWQPGVMGDWAASIDGAYAVVNLAGEATFGTKWTPEFRQRLRANRIGIAESLVQAMANARLKPQVFIEGSSIGSYGLTTLGPAVIDETGPYDDDSYAEESLAIETAAAKAEALGVRTVLLRTAYVLERDAGGLPAQAGAVRRFQGGIILPGTQWVPWVHIADEVGIICYVLTDEQVRGPINAVAPETLTSRDFMRTLGRVLKRPIIFRVPGFVLRQFLGDGAAILTSGRRVVPRRILALGYQFQHPTLEGTLRDLLGR